MVRLKQIISNMFSIGVNLKLTKEELELLTQYADGEFSMTRPKNNWATVDSEYEPSLAIEPGYVDKVLHCRDIANSIYDQADEAGIRYASGWEYFCLVLRTMRCISKCAFLMDDED